MSITTGRAKSSSGWLNGLLGVIIFSGSLPATRIAVLDLDPLFVTVARASIAGVLAVIVLLFKQEKFPQSGQFCAIGLVALGVVIGFPLLSALALSHVTSAHSIVFVGILPLSTAIFGIIRGGERPRPVFWIFSIVGSLLVVGFALIQGFSSAPIGDILMLLAIILCGMGYAEGGKLSKTLGGWQVISWALVFSLPVALPLTILYLPSTTAHVSMGAWTGLAYISFFSMFIGFIFWYKGLAQGGIATIGQLQLLQPFFGLILAASLLHEEVSSWMFLITIGVILCVGGAKRFA